jgi:hypothetical protein
LTTRWLVRIDSNTEAELLFRKREGLSETAFVEMVIWRVPDPVRGSGHGFKYRLALVSDGVCVLRYDNETGKGDHKHIGEREAPYPFTDLATLETDFWKDVETWRAGQ